MIILLLQSHTKQFLQCTIKDIQIDFFFNARNIAHIGMLPKVPFTFILYGINVIMGYPIRIRIKNRIV